MDDVNSVMFHQLEDNRPSQGIDAEVATGFSTKSKFSC